MEDSTTEVTRASVERKIDSYVEGDLEHATEVVSALWEIVNKDGEITAPESTPSSVSSFLVCPPSLRYAEVLKSNNQAAQLTGPADSVKTALIKSIRKGVLFDRKYWVRHSRTGGALKPVYFSSIVMSDKLQQLNNRELEFGRGFC